MTSSSYHLRFLCLLHQNFLSSHALSALSHLPVKLPSTCWDEPSARLLHQNCSCQGQEGPCFIQAVERSLVLLLSLGGLKHRNSSHSWLLWISCLRCFPLSVSQPLLFPFSVSLPLFLGSALRYGRAPHNSETFFQPLGFSCRLPSADF